MDRKESILECVGRTPILLAQRYAQSKGLEGIALYTKLEMTNPAGSSKDRAALWMVRDAEERGILEKGTTIIEPTSGNMGIALAFVGAVKGYSVILTMPENMSEERRRVLSGYGAKVILTPESEGMQGAIRKAEELHEKIKGSVILGQFDNPANPRVHFDTTGAEIWGQMSGNVDIFVAGVGTGGTITGVGEYLKQKNPKVKIVAVEPKGSPILSVGRGGSHQIQGIGAGFVPKVLNREILDEVIAVGDEEAFAEARRFAKTEGMLVGISSGAALKACEVLARRIENRGKNLVVLLPDGGERYLSIPLFL